MKNITGFQFGFKNPCRLAKVTLNDGFFTIDKTYSCVPSEVYHPNISVSEAVKSTIIDFHSSDIDTIYLDNSCFYKASDDSKMIADIFEELDYTVKRFDKSCGVVEKRKELYGTLLNQGKISAHYDDFADIISQIIYELHKEF